jgi:cephalosporin hydroxylase
MNKTSVIIPSRNEELYLNKTVESVLENSTRNAEVIVVLDGWEPTKRIPGVVYIKHEVAKGQRPSINEAAKIARGNWVMKLDAHCAVGKGFDEILMRDCEYDMTMIPAMFNLDVTTWEPRCFDNWEEAVRLGKLNPYMYIGWKDGRLRTQYYNGSLRKKIYANGKDKPIDETMSCMGPCFFMHKDRFWELGGCDENHGHWGQQGVEVACKAWLSGGRLMTNKNTWFAHFFRGGGVPEGHKKGFPYPISQKQVNRARDYSEGLWLNNEWKQQTRTMEWLVRKFTPPSWDGYYINNTPIPIVEGPERVAVNSNFYKHIHRCKNHPQWRGIPILKMATDLINYSEVIQETEPDLIIEIGTKFGGSALFFQDMLGLQGNGRVVTIDINAQVQKHDDRIEYLQGSSLDSDIVEYVHKSAHGKKTMLVVDGNHNRKHVKWELHKYRDIVTPGQYLVVEDCYIDRGLYGPGEARDWFLKNYKGFEQTNRCQKFCIGVCMGGWLRRV